MQSNEVAFARPSSADAGVFVAMIGPDKFLQFRPETGAAAITAKGKKAITGTWRLNENPSGKAPSAWLTIGKESFALWYDHERQFYSVKVSENATDGVKILI